MGVGVGSCVGSSFFSPQDVIRGMHRLTAINSNQPLRKVSFMFINFVGLFFLNSFKHVVTRINEFL